MDLDRCRLLIGLLLWLGFFLMFFGAKRLKALEVILKKTKSNMDEAVRKRLLNNRRNLTKLQKEEGFWFSLERQLGYAGLRRRFPFLSAEHFVLLTVLAMAGCFLVGAMLGGILWGLGFAVCVVLAECAMIVIGKAGEMHAVNENLMKLLDFLGNYSMTSGDVVSVFSQVGKYLEEPIRSALEQCCVEAQTTGDVGLALLSMAEKIEHPQFKELVRNIEVSCRYSADFSVLVSFSRRSVREYLKSCRERKSLLREAGINMALLLGMSVFAMATVNGLLEVSVWTMLFFTIPGRIALGIVIGIVLLFAMQVYRLES
ncbi:MAG: hypothetical protein J6Z22_01135 [Lachnospiraceae bacterium]|nr:hypothetical protein [Lachnospiraceae bacterium]